MTNNFRAVHQQLQATETLINSVPVKTKVAELALNSAIRYLSLSAEWVRTAEKREAEANPK